jgi:hypothetical protein
VRRFTELEEARLILPKRGLDVDQLEAIAALLAKHKGAPQTPRPAIPDRAADGGLEFRSLRLLDDDQKSIECFKTRD